MGVAAVALLTAAQPAAAQDVVIDEFRFYGPGADRDNFIELRNRTLQPINLNVDPDDPGAPWYFFLYASKNDGFGDPDAGWYEVDIPEDVTIPTRGRVLLDDSAFSIAKTADGRPEWFGTDLAHDGGAELYKGDCDAAGNNCVYTYQDGVGMVNNGQTYDPDLNPSDPNDAADPPNQNLGEGTLLPTTTFDTFQWSFVRNSNGGNPVDTNSNAADFRRVGTNATFVTFGAPGPQNAADPREGDTRIGTYLVDSAVSANAAPNREVTATAVPNKIIKIRRMVRNDAPAGTPAVTQLRYRVPNITTDNSPGASGSQAILRWRDAAPTALTGFTGKPYNGVTPTGVQVAEVAPQTEGGWNNASENIPLPGGTLTPGESFYVEFWFRVQQGGNYTVWFNAESAPNPAPVG